MKAIFANHALRNRKTPSRYRTPGRAARYAMRHPSDVNHIVSAVLKMRGNNTAARFLSLVEQRKVHA